VYPQCGSAMRRTPATPTCFVLQRCVGDWNAMQHSDQFVPLSHGTRPAPRCVKRTTKPLVSGRDHEDYSSTSYSIRLELSTSSPSSRPSSLSSPLNSDADVRMVDCGSTLSFGRPPSSTLHGHDRLCPYDVIPVEASRDASSELHPSTLCYALSR